MYTTAEQMSERKSQMRAAADAYFSGLANRDLSAVAYDEHVQFRTPLAPGGSAVPILGRIAVLDFFAGLYAALGDVNVVDYFFNDTLTTICVKADVKLKSGQVLRVVDLFNISADGKVTEQENHYDPSPATVRISPDL